jgi:hypothetical protein
MIIALLWLTRTSGPSAEGARDRETNALLEIRSVIVDGAPVSPRPAEKLRLSSHPRTVTFAFGPTTNAIRQPIRIRFKLDGYDEGWREQDGEMRLCVRFLDGTGDQVNETILGPLVRALAGPATRKPPCSRMSGKPSWCLPARRASGW